MDTQQELEALRAVLGELIAALPPGLPLNKRARAAVKAGRALLEKNNEPARR